MLNYPQYTWHKMAGEEIVLEKICFDLDYALPEFTDMSVKAEADDAIKQIILRFKAYMYAEQHKHIEIKYPEDWWQAFKHRWYPDWLLKRYPIRYKEHIIDVKAFYPGYKVSIPEREIFLRLLCK